MRLLPIRSHRMLWSLGWAFRWLSRLRRRLILDLFEPISDSWLAFVHRDCRVIFIECWRFFVCLNKLLFVVHFMVATKGWWGLDKWWGRIFAYTGWLFDKVILQMPLILRSVFLHVLFRLGPPLINFWVSWLLAFRYLWLEARWWFLLSQMRAWMLNCFFLMNMDFLAWWLRKIARNSCVRIKAVDIWFVTWSWNVLRILYVLTAPIGVCVAVNAWVVLVLPMVLSRGAISVRQMLVSLWVIRMALTAMIHSVLCFVACAFAGATLILLCLGCWAWFISSAAWALLLLQDAPTHMEGRLMQAKIVLDIVVLCNSVLRLRLAGLF